MPQENPLTSGRQYVSNVPVQAGPGIVGSFTGNIKDLPAGMSIVPSSEQSTPEPTQPKYQKSDWAVKANKGNYDRATESILDSFKDAEHRHVTALMTKYSSIASMQKQDKIEALKSPDMNPFLMASDNAYDGLAAGYHKWTVIGAKAEGLPQEQRIQIAKNFRNKMLLPLYQNLGREPISEDVWLRAAYDKDGALGYKVENAYSTFKSLHQGWGSFVKSAANAEETVVNILGRGVGYYTTPHLPGQWAQQMLNEQNNKEGFFQENRRITQELPVLGAFSRMADWDSSIHSFWHDAIPNWNFTEKAMSVVAENAPQLGLFKALAAANEIVVGGTAAKILTKVPGGSLTASLAATPAGKFVAKTLLAGTENVLYGKLVRDQNDKEGSIRDMLTGMVLSAPFNFRGRSGTLAEHFPKDPKAQVIGQKAAEVEGHVKNKTREGTPAEYNEEFKRDMQNNISVVGLHGQEVIDEHGLTKALEWSLLPRDAEHQARVEFIDRDVVQHSNVASAATRIQQIAKSMGKPLKEILGNPELKAQLLNTLDGMRREAASLLHQTESVQQATAAQATAKAKVPGAAVVRDTVKTKMLNNPQIATALKAGQIKPEQFEKMVDAEYGKAVAKAAALAEKKAVASLRTASKGQKIGRQRVAVESARDAGRLKARTSYSTNKAGEPSVSYSVGKTWDAYLKSNGLISKNNTALEQHLQDLGTEDFSNLMHEFLPPQLKEAGIHFEPQWEQSRGPNNPNLYGFMYNYMKFLPTPLKKELPNRLMETLKIANNMPKNYVMPEGMLQMFAKSMFNHVDNFLGSVKSSSESNIFRSTLPNLRDATMWQGMSLVERMAQDEKLVKSMFAGHPEETQGALKVVRAFHRELAALVKNPQTDMTPVEFKHASDKLADFLVDKSTSPTSKFKLDKFDYNYETTGGYK